MRDINTYAIRSNRLYLLFPPELTFDIRQIEGARWHNDLKVWSMPASWRAIKELAALGFQPRNEETEIYRTFLENLALKGTTSWATPTLETAGKVLFPWQAQGVTFLEARDNALLYDPPGMGKTIQALTWAKADPRTLVVCPKAVVYQWADLINDMGKVVLVQPEGLIPWDTWAVTNYERLGRLNHHKDLTLIVDECHFIKNPKSQRSKLVLAHSRAASKVLAVSGTPMVNRPVELWPIYLLLKERNSNEFWGYVQHYCGADRDDFGHWDFSGATHLDELKDDLLHFAIRRPKELVDLPPKTYMTLRVHVSKGEQNEIGERDREVLELLGQGYGAFREEGFGALQRLRVSSANAKVTGVQDFIRNHFEGNGGPIAVFAGFKEPLRRIADDCEGVLYTGDQTDNERARGLELLRTGQSNTICLTYGAGGTGLDGLQNSVECVILLDLPWTPQETEQAEDRVHRIGLEHPINIVSVWSGSKVEEIILRARDKKMDVISYLMESI